MSATPEGLPSSVTVNGVPACTALSPCTNDLNNALRLIASLVLKYPKIGAVGSRSEVSCSEGTTLQRSLLWFGSFQIKPALSLNDRGPARDCKRADRVSGVYGFGGAIWNRAMTSLMSGPRSRPVTALRRGMNRLLPLRPVVSLTAAVHVPQVLSS